MSSSDAKELVKSIIGENNEETIQRLVFLSSRNTLILVIAAQLIRDKKLSSSLLEDENLVNKVFIKLLDELNQITETDGIDLRELLGILSAISPFNPNSKDTQKSLSEFLDGIEWYKISKAVDKLINIGFILKRINSFKVVPDVLADYILYGKSFDSSKNSTGFIDKVFKEFGKEYLANILQNAVEVESRIIKNEESQKLLSNIWRTIENEIKNAGYSELVHILDILKKVSFFAPKKTFTIIECILNENPLLIESSKDSSAIESPNWLIEHLSPVLKNIAYNPQYTQKVCVILWKLANEKFPNIQTNSHPRHPLRVLSEMASLDNRNYFSVVHNTLDSVREIIKNKDHLNCYYHIQEIINSALKSEIENQTSTLRQFSLSWFCVFDANQKDKERIIKIREKAFSILELLIKDENPANLTKTAEVLIQKMSNPHVRGKISNEAINEFRKEGERAFELIKMILQEHKFDSVNNYVITQLISKERYLIKELIPFVDAYVSKIKFSFKDEVMYCLSHDWAEFNPDEEHDITDKKFNDRQGNCAKKLWVECKNEPKEVIGYIKDIIAEFSESGLICNGYVFQYKCAEVATPELANKAVIEILSIKDISFGSSLSNWLWKVPEEEKYSLAIKILNNGNIEHKKGLALAINSFININKTELIEILTKLLKDENETVKSIALSSLGRLYKKLEKPIEIINLLCGFDIKNDVNLLEKKLENISDKYGIPLSDLNETHVDILLNQFINVEKLTDQYHLGIFLSHVANNNPLRIVKLLLKRVDNSIPNENSPKNRDYQVFPYIDFHTTPEKVIQHSEFPECIRTIIDYMYVKKKKNYWEPSFWCPKIFKWLDPNFSEKTLKILENIITAGKPEDLKNIAYIFAEYERDLFFSHTDFINKLLLKSNEVDDECYEVVASKISFMPFSGTRSISGPGEPDDLCLRIIKKCDEILSNTSIETKLREFYKGLKKYAEDENIRKLERDKAEIEEWGEE